MTLQVGDKVVTIPLRDGGRVTVRSGTISVGDKAVLIPGANGQIYAVRPASPQVGDKVILYPLRNGGHVCLASADDEGGSSPSVMPPGNFDVRRTGPSTADLEWLPGEGNTAVRIVRRPDRYPVHINDGTAVYEGAGNETTDAGLDFRNSYYYCAWGRAGSKYSNGYLMDRIGSWGAQSDPVHVCDAWVRAASHKGEVVSLGTYTYLWDGTGRVYLSSNPNSRVNMWADDQVRAHTLLGSVSSGSHVNDRYVCDISGILSLGSNKVTIQIVDIHGVEIGSSAIYIMRAL